MKLIIFCLYIFIQVIKQYGDYLYSTSSLNKEFLASQPNKASHCNICSQSREIYDHGNWVNEVAMKESVRDLGCSAQGLSPILCIKLLLYADKTNHTTVHHLKHPVSWLMFTTSQSWKLKLSLKVSSSK